jgi:hydrogenase maturation protease
MKPSPASGRTIPGSRAAILVLGIGNDFRRDDGAGRAIARRIRAAGLSGVVAEEHTRDLASLLEAWADFDTVIVADAVSSGAHPGTVFRFDAGAAPLPAIFGRQVSSHGVGPAEAIELARALGQLPDRLIVYGIEGADFRDGAGLSPPVEEGVSEIVREVMSHMKERHDA